MYTVDTCVNHMCMYINVCMYVCMYKGKYAFINLSEDTINFDEVVSGTKPEPKEVRTFLHSYIHSYIHAYIHTYIHFIVPFS